MERVTSPTASSDLRLGPVAEEVAALVDEDRRPVATALVRAVYRRVADLPPSAAQRVVSSLALMERRPSGALSVRAINPSLEVNGYTADGTVVEVSVEDRPFLLTTTTEELKRLGLSCVVLLHPIVGVERGAGGGLVAVTGARGAPSREALLHLELSRRLDDERLDLLVDDLTRVLTDALAVTGDFQAMREQLDEAAFALRAAAGGRYPLEEVDEASALLRWLLEDHFILLGSSQWERVADAGDGSPLLRCVADSGLGIDRDVAPDEAQPARVGAHRLVALTRTSRVATVHRQVRMVAVAVRTVDDAGDLTGEHRVLGLFAQRAYAEPASTTPVLRRLLQHVLESEDVVDGSDDERQLRSLFEAFPKHELFAAEPDDLRATLVALLTARRTQDVRVLGRVDPETDMVSILVGLPRDRFSAGVRRRVQELLTERFAATAVDYHLSLDEQDQALLQFALRVPDVAADALDSARLDDLERAVTVLTRTFLDELRAELRRTHDPVSAERVAEAFVQRLPPGYVETTSARLAAVDVAEVGGVAGGGARVHLRQEPGEPSDRYRLRLYRSGPPLELSTFLPVLESLGLTVEAELSHRIAAADGRPTVEITDFGVRPDRDLGRTVALDVDRDGPRIADTVLAMLRGDVEADSLHRLVLAAGLRWEDVDVLRCYRHYRRQVGTTFTPRFLADALVANPEVARALVALFAARFDPARADEADAQETARQRVLEQLRTTQRFDEDRILRDFLALVDATLRTNRYTPPRRGRRGCLALKFASDQVPGMPRPVPEVEVFVAGPDVQGVHLRGGRVARGGLRWSDRREDFRTEVLGLMKAQMTKNALIVPTGAKGGFVLTRSVADPLEQREAVREAYTTFVRGLLDLADNVVGGQVATPPTVRRYDGDDPYLVVAADRGTSTFSDLANEIAAEYDFWLGDAFASGGSRGYDHKAMGITARGAWLAVRRHFRELDVDVQTEPVRVVGIGDMSGDVFGNGLLQSRSVRLVAAFDHRDVFIDPDPDPEVSFGERERLYAKTPSSWRDYDRALISEGGGVWSRTQRVVELSDQVRDLLRVTDEQLSPPEVIQAILRAPVDLLFAGGIGTFVRSTKESDLDVGDRANDTIRVTAAELGARVVGEGGNLALTQRARIQYSRRGGRCNTDAIDNVGGVDTSDREVNLKILLRQAVEDGDLTLADRDELLATMTSDVAAAVLRDVDLQAGALSAEVDGSPARLDAYAALMRDLEEDGGLARDVEVLPDDRELEARRDAGAGLVRPELAVLLGYAKVDHTVRLLRSDLPDEPWLRTLLDGYFPPAVVTRFGHRIGDHRLRRELVATIMANRLVDRMGITYPSRTAHELGCMAWEVAAAWWAAREVTQATLRWDDVEALATRVTPALEAELAEEVRRLVDTVTRAYLRHGVGGDVGAVVARDRPAFAELAGLVDDVVPPARRAAREQRVGRWLDLGVTEEVARAFGALRDLTVVPDVASVADDTGADVRHVGEVFWRLSEALPLDELVRRLQGVRTFGAWQYWQQRGLADELRELRRTGAALVVREQPGRQPSDAVERFLVDRAAVRERVRVLLAALDREGPAGLDGLGVVARALRTALTPGPLPDVARSAE